MFLFVSCGFYFLSFLGDVDCYFDGVCLFSLSFKEKKLTGNHRLMIVQKKKIEKKIIKAL